MEILNNIITLVVVLFILFGGFLLIGVAILLFKDGEDFWGAFAVALGAIWELIILIVFVFGQ